MNSVTNSLDSVLPSTALIRVKSMSVSSPVIVFRRSFHRSKLIKKVGILQVMTEVALSFVVV